ncbi:hypothetical protein [Sphingomonas sp.]|uniref:HNH endonuclease domain-containing protein n=1 Tax=Sphingomonas sp. TaxID=28214 RepID=UPI0034272427
MAALDIDHCLPWSAWPCGDLWNLMPANRRVNQHQKRDRLPSQPMLAQSRSRILGWWDAAWSHNEALHVRFLREAAAALRSTPMLSSRRCLPVLNGAGCSCRRISRYRNGHCGCPGSRTREPLTLDFLPKRPGALSNRYGFRRLHSSIRFDLCGHAGRAIPISAAISQPGACLCWRLEPHRPVERGSPVEACRRQPDRYGCGQGDPQAPAARCSEVLTDTVLRVIFRVTPPRGSWKMVASDMFLGRLWRLTWLRNFPRSMASSALPKRRSATSA